MMDVQLLTKKDLKNVETKVDNLTQITEKLINTVTSLNATEGDTLKMYSRQELRELLGCSYKTIERLEKRGKLTAKRFLEKHGKVFYDHNEVKDLLGTL